MAPRPNSPPNPDGSYTLPVAGKIFHKSRMPKVMFLAAVARPRPEYDFDGKIGIYPFAIERLAQRNNKRTGTKAGETVIVEDVKVFLYFIVFHTSPRF